MIIKKVELINFRNHRNSKFDFKEGINLIIGKNGSGKSSILEAIGLTLFGADLRGTIKDAIQKGEKTGIIRIEFIDNQGKIYRTEKFIGANSKQYLIKADGDFRLENQNQILQEIANLSGIETNTKNIFQDVISAYQNQFTGIFAGNDTSRQKTFNRIFNTEIYREIYDGFSKSAIDKYSIERELEVKELEKFQLKLKDIQVLRIEFEEINKLKTEKEIELKEIKDELNKLENEKKRLEKVKQNIELLNNTLFGIEEQLADKQNQIKKTEEEIAQAEVAEQILVENKEQYEEYIKINEDLKQINESVNKLEKIETDKLELEKQKTKIENYLIKSETEIEVLDKVIQEKTKELEQKSIDIKRINESINEKNNEKNELINQKEIFEEKFTKLENKYHQLSENTKTIEKLEFQLTEKEKQKVDLSKIEERIQILITDKNDLLEKDKERKSLEHEISKIIERIRENDSAYTKLSSGKCPYLKEECENIKKGTSIEEYFNERKKNLEIELEILQNNLDKYKDLDKNIRENSEKIAVLNKTKSDGESVLKDISSLKNKLDLFLKDKQIIILEMKSYEKNFINKISEMIYSEDFENALKEIKKTISNYDNQISAIIATLNELNKNLNNLESDKKENDIILNKTKNDKTELEKSIKDAQNKINGMTEQINKLSSLTNELLYLKEKREDLNNHSEKLKPFYLNYIKNEKKAGEKEKYIQAKNNLEKDILKLNNDIKDIEVKLAEYKNDFKEEVFATTCENIESYKQDYDKLIQIIADLRNRQENKRREIEENENIQEEINELKESIAVFDKKIVLTNEFRNNIRIMGKLVASRLLERIEKQATENYRLISGRNEYINWVNDEVNAYKVLLCDAKDKTNRREFEVLSGGEQVMVALALRSAMATLLTKAQFAIFDEPTINLDNERRVALADSLRFMLKQLQQAIIVTHDDSFSNMANNIIQI